MQKFSTSTLIPVSLSASAITLAFIVGVWKGQLERRIEGCEDAARQITYIQSQIMILRQDIEIIKAELNESHRSTSNETPRRRDSRG